MKSVQIRTRKNSVFGHFSRTFFRIILEIEVLHIIHIYFANHWTGFFIVGTSIVKELNESKCFEILSLDNILINISNITSRNKSLNVNLLGVIKFRMLQQKVIKTNYVRSTKLQKPIRAIRFLVKHILRFQNRSFVSGNETSFPNCYSNLDLKICFKHAKTIQIRSLVFGIKVSFSHLKFLFQISIPVEICSFVSRIEASFPESKLLFQSGNLIYNLLNNSNSRFVSNFLLQLRFEASNYVLFQNRSYVSDLNIEALLSTCEKFKCKVSLPICCYN